MEPHGLPTPNYCEGSPQCLDSALQPQPSYPKIPFIRVFSAQTVTLGMPILGNAFFCWSSQASFYSHISAWHVAPDVQRLLGRTC